MAEKEISLPVGLIVDGIAPSTYFAKYAVLPPDFKPQPQPNAIKVKVPYFLSYETALAYFRETSSGHEYCYRAKFEVTENGMHHLFELDQTRKKRSFFFEKDRYRYYPTEDLIEKLNRIQRKDKPFKDGTRHKWLNFSAVIEYLEISPYEVYMASHDSNHIYILPISGRYMVELLDGSTLESA
ncbi:MAG: hypothetical protein FWC51_02995, partial [Proteobacteria bacterium]|nr:hypothetical protein [Pseudomonadota bacterium]